MVETEVSPEEEILTRARVLSDVEVSAIGSVASPRMFHADIGRIREALGRVLEAGYLQEHQLRTFRLMASELDAVENMARAAPQDLFR